jgi:hypothetical protein
VKTYVDLLTEVQAIGRRRGWSDSTLLGLVLAYLWPQLGSDGLQNLVLTLERVAAQEEERIVKLRRPNFVPPAPPEPRAPDVFTAGELPAPKRGER